MRKRALSCVIKSCQELLGLRPRSVPIYTDGQSYEMPADGAKIIVIQRSPRPSFVFTLERYSEPGNPVLHYEYKSMESFVFGFFEVPIRNVAGQLARQETGLPHASSSDYSSDKLTSFITRLNEHEHFLRLAIKNKISEPQFQLVERYIWRQ